MAHYGDQARPRAGALAVQPPEALASARLSISRRPLFDLPILPAALPLASSSAAPQATDVNPDADLGSFDVPAFLRRQEG